MEGAAPLQTVVRRAGPAGWLLIILLACVLYAVFASGAASVPEESRVQIGLAIGLLLAGVGIAAGALGTARAGLAWGGVGMLALFAFYSALSVSWSLAPDLGWLAANRAAAYAAVVAVALVAAPSVRRAPELALAGLTGVALLAALYALGGKLFPTVSIGPINLDNASDFARLRAPIGYWNALGLLLVMAMPGCILVAAERAREPRLRIGALLALSVLLATTALTLSRGAVVAFFVVLAVMVGAGPDRLRRLGVAAAALLAAAPVIAVDFIRNNLHDNGIAAHDRVGDGLLLAFVLAVSLLALAWFAVYILDSEEYAYWDSQSDRRAWTLVAAIAVGLALAALTALAFSDRGPTATVSHAWNEFRQPQTQDPNNPSRLVSSSGSNRWTWWREAGGAFSDKPIAGWGAGSFPILHDRYREADTQVKSAHSVPLQFLAEGGLIGLVLALAGLGLLAAGGISAYFYSSAEDRGPRLALLAVGAAWAVHCLYDWDWEIPAVTLPALVAVAVAAAPHGPSRDWLEIGGASGRRTMQLGREAAIPLAVAAALIAVSFAISAGLPAISQGKRSAAQVAAGDAGDADVQDALSDALLAHKLNPLDIESLFTASDIELQLGRPARANALSLEAAETQPDNRRVWDRLLASGQPALARLAIPHLLSTEPFTVAVQGGLARGIAYSREVPPALSPTAFGTPPAAPAP